MPRYGSMICQGWMCRVIGPLAPTHVSVTKDVGYFDHRLPPAEFLPQAYKRLLCIGLEVVSARPSGSRWYYRFRIVHCPRSVERIRAEILDRPVPSSLPRDPWKKPVPKRGQVQ